MTGEEQYVLEEQIGFLLRKANQRHRLIFFTESGNEISPQQFAVLVQLFEVGEVSQNQLGRLTALDSATTSGIVTRLRNSGYVGSRKSKEDARLRMIRLTSKGQSTVKRLIPIARRISDITVNQLTDDEIATLSRLLARISV